MMGRPELKADIFVVAGDVIGKENLHPSLTYLILCVFFPLMLVC